MCYLGQVKAVNWDFVHTMRHLEVQIEHTSGANFRDFGFSNEPHKIVARNAANTSFSAGDRGSPVDVTPFREGGDSSVYREELW